MRSLRSIRPLDAAIVAVAVLVFVLAGFLGYSVWSQNRSISNSTPVARAINDLQAKIKKKPNDIPLRMELAQTYTVAGRDKDAINQYRQVLTLKKDYVPAISGLGFIASRQQDWKASESYWRKAVDLMADSPTAQMSKQYETANFYLATTLLEQKKYTDAVGYYKESLRVNSSASDTHYLLANAYKGLGDMDAYRDELEVTLAFDPVMPEANYDFGLLLLKKGDEPGAAQHFRIAADQAPDREEPQAALEKLGPFSKRFAAARKLASSDSKKATNEARIAVAIEPRNTEALLLLAKLYEDNDEKALAADTYRNILSFDGENAKAKIELERVTNGK